MLRGSLRGASLLQICMGGQLVRPFLLTCHFFKIGKDKVSGIHL